MKLRGNKKGTVLKKITHIPDMIDIDIEEIDKEVNKIRQENNEHHEPHGCHIQKIHGCCFVF